MNVRKCKNVANANKKAKLFWTYSYKCEQIIALPIDGLKIPIGSPPPFCETTSSAICLVKA